MIFMHGGTQILELTNWAVGWAVALAALVLQFGSVVRPSVEGLGVWVASQLPVAVVRTVKNGTVPERCISFGNHQRPYRSLGQNRDEMCSGLTLAVEASRFMFRDRFSTRGNWGGASQPSRLLLTATSLSIRAGLTRDQSVLSVSVPLVSTNSPAVHTSQFSGLNRSATAL